MSIQWNKSTCPYCGLGCGLMVGVDNGNIKAMSRPDGFSSLYFVCFADK